MSLFEIAFLMSSKASYPSFVPVTTFLYVDHPHSVFSYCANMGIYFLGKLARSMKLFISFAARGLISFFMALMSFSIGLMQFVRILCPKTLISFMRNLDFQRSILPLSLFILPQTRSELSNM
jgi:nucleoside permease NupC